MLTGLNHITISVSKLSESLDFYVGQLGFTIKAKWNNGAYLLLGELWLCLSMDIVSIGDDYTHYALSVPREKFDIFAERLRIFGVTEWKHNQSEGKSLYFLDPDGHRLEVHDGNLESRLSACLSHPYEGMEFF